MLLTWLLLFVFAAPLAVVVLGAVRPKAAGAAATVAGAGAFALALAAWVFEAGGLRLAWIPAWGVELSFQYDGLAALYALLATGIGTVVLLFASRYMPAHVRKAGLPPRALTRFFGLMSLFMAAMVGLVTARELYSLTLFWDLTAVTSFLLIATDWKLREARDAAQVALFVTAGSAVLLLIAVVLIHAQTGTTEIGPALSALSEGLASEAIVVLVAVAALAKSAQAPFHFWLPRAMLAPTPVSAYLHSAAMVAAGVFLLSVMHPLIERTAIGPPLLVAVGAASIAVGSALALTSSEVKRILAYSTSAQYGYVVLMLGWGGAAGASGAAYYVLAHAMAKSGLFMAAGAASKAVGGEKELQKMGGLFGRMPVWAIASAVCAAALAGLPLTAGYFKDELFFGTAVHRGSAAVIFAVGSAALTLAYTWRLWSGMFLGAPPHGISRRRVLPAAPIAIVAAALVVGGLFNAPYAALAEAAGGVIHAVVEPIPDVPQLRINAQILMALVAYGAGAALILLRRRTALPWRAIQKAGERAGPERLYGAGGHAAGGVAWWLYDREAHDLRGRLAAVLVPGAAVIAASLPAVWETGRLHAGTVRGADAPLVAVLLLLATAAVATTRPSRHLTLVLAASLATYALATVFVLLGAPDVALVTIVVQTAVSLLLVAMLTLFPSELLHHVVRLRSERRWRGAVTGMAGVGAFIVAWVMLSMTAGSRPADTYLALAPMVHAQDVVTAILADFRGLDTLGESTVLAIALVGLASLLIDRWSDA